MKTKRFYFFALLLFPLVILISQCLTPEKQDPRDAIFAGADKCQKCHKDVYNDYIHTVHYTSSRPASMQTIHGSFTGNHTFLLSPAQKIVMEKRNSGLYQAYYVNGKLQQAERFDITFGGIKAESYMYWKGNQLFQLPMSYFSALQSWTNSPGYRTDKADFERPILRRCFECHSSYIRELPQQTIDMQHRVVEFDKSSLILGIDCERCHGPAANHVNYHTEFPNEKKARYINTYASLSRQQKLDACAVCHASNKEAFMVTSFKFKMGDTLSKFKEPNFLPENPNPDKLDVHGNQSGLLATSKCFIMSKMDCSNCHNPHTSQKLDLSAYSQKCMACHSEANHNFCKLAPKLGGIIKQNCIDCHMPLKPSNVIGVEVSGGKKAVPYTVRTHHIGIYPKESQKILATYVSKLTM